MFGLIFGVLIGYFFPRFEILFILLGLSIIYDVSSAYSVESANLSGEESLYFIFFCIIFSVIKSLFFVATWFLGYFFKKHVLN